MKKSILYFDADATCLERLQDMLGGEYDVRVATTLSEARRTLEERAADVIISEQDLPEIRGTDFLREAAATCPASYRVMLTGDIITGDAIREVSTGVIHIFIPKPWTAENMRKAVELAEMQFRLQSRPH